MKQINAPLTQLALVILAMAMIIGGGMYFYSSYSDSASLITKYERENAILDNRIQILSNSSEDLAQYSNIAYRSVPETNAGLLAINSIKDLGTLEDVFIDRVYVRSSAVEEGTRQPSEVGFEVEGEVGKVLTFLSRITRALPLIRLVDLSTTVTSDNFASSILSMETYSQTLPKELPSLNEDLPVLSESEKQTITELDSYHFPSLTGQPEIEPEEEGIFGRENPFSQIEGSQVEEEQ